MAFLQQFKDRIGRYYLAKERAQSRYPQVMNFHLAKSLAFLYYSESESSLIMMKQYMKELKSEFGIPEMMAFAYIPEKEPPSYHKHQLEFDFCSKKELNWYGKPKAENVKNFVNRDFDVLLDLTRGGHLPLEFMLKQSRAKFKVGMFDPQRERNFDLNIDIKKGNNLEDFIRQVNHFLNRINHRA